MKYLNSSFWKLLFAYWLSPQKKWAWFWLFSIVICAGLETYLSLRLTLFYTVFYTALQTFNQPQILSALKEYFLLIISLTTFLSLGFILCYVLANHWQKWLRHNHLQNWLTNQGYLWLERNQHIIDNADQRIDEDTAEFSLTCSLFFHGFVTATLKIMVFSKLLWHLSMPIFFSSFTLHGYLFWLVILYALISTWVGTLIGKPLAPREYLMQQANADFRFHLARIRENAESIALQKSEKSLLHQLTAQIEEVFVRRRTFLRFLFNFSVYQNVFFYVNNLVGLAAGLPQFLKKYSSFGQLMQIQSAFIEMFNGLGYLLNSYQDIAKIFASSSRLIEYTTQLNQWQSTPKNIDCTIWPSHNLVIDIKQVSTPNKKTLLTAFHLTINAGDRLFITGPSGSGKTTLLKTIAGAWPHAIGKILLPDEKIFFMPQTIYWPNQSLGDLLTPSETPSLLIEQTIENALEMVNLAHLFRDANKALPWQNRLSPGEQQRLLFAKIYLQKPAWIFLDEATSAIEAHLEKKIFEQLFQLLPNAGILSVGHRAPFGQWQTLTIDWI